jgi:hypothetical protein
MDLMIKILVTTFFVVSICLLATAIHNLIVDIVFGFLFRLVHGFSLVGRV